MARAASSCPVTSRKRSRRPASSTPVACPLCARSSPSSSHAIARCSARPRRHRRATPRRHQRTLRRAQLRGLDHGDTPPGGVQDRPPTASLQRVLRGLPIRQQPGARAPVAAEHQTDQSITHRAPVQRTRRHEVNRRARSFLRHAMRPVSLTRTKVTGDAKSIAMDETEHSAAGPDARRSGAPTAS